MGRETASIGSIISQLPMKAVEINHLYKSYNGKPAVEDLTFSVKSGELLGLIGPNGAGKSTTIKILLDFMKTDSGEARIFGEPMNEKLKNKIGYLPEERGLYKRLPAIDQILYFSSLKGMNHSAAAEKADQLLRQTGMLESKQKKIKDMSKGMGQIIQFIVTIIHDPQLIILDEPFSGLDPVNTEMIKHMIERLRDEGKTIFLSTHQMNQVEELCDRVLMINHGREVLYGDLQEIKNSYKKHSVLVDVDGQIGNLNGVINQKMDKGLVELVLSPETTPQNILDQIHKKGMTVHHFEIKKPSLNEIFIHLAGGNHE
jgi:ABC-2 type transport system ATP-binding protein